MKTLLLERLSDNEIDCDYYGYVEVAIPVLMLAPNDQEGELTLEDLCSEFTKDYNITQVMKDIEALKTSYYSIEEARTDYNKALAAQRSNVAKENKTRKAIKSLKEINLPYDEVNSELKRLEEVTSHLKQVAKDKKELHLKSELEFEKVESKFEEIHEDWMRVRRYYDVNSIIKNSQAELPMNTPAQILGQTNEVKKFIKFLENRGWTQFDLTNTVNEVYSDDNAVTVKELYEIQ